MAFIKEEVLTAYVAQVSFIKNMKTQMGTTVLKDTCEHWIKQQAVIKNINSTMMYIMYKTWQLITIPPYDSSETITESLRVVAGRLRFSRRSPETTRRH